MASRPPFHTLALVGNPHDARVSESMQLLATHLLERGRRVLVDAATPVDFGALPVERLAEGALGSAADLVVAVGGDGTMLHAARLVSGSGISGNGVPILGVNRGRLGFLADVGTAEMRERIDDVLAGRFVEDRRAMFRARLTEPDGTETFCDALNDVVLQKWETGRMLDFETWIDGRYVNTHGGDGLVVATATGSTAYALSCGGPILHPAIDALVLVPICPHTLSDRPIVVGSSATVEIRLVERPDTRAQITCDGVTMGELEPGDRLFITPARASVTLLHPSDHDYYRILRSKLRWGRGDRAVPGAQAED